MGLSNFNQQMTKNDLNGWIDGRTNEWTRVSIFSLGGVRVQIPSMFQAAHLDMLFVAHNISQPLKSK
jgi:hypothetical protein